MQRRALAIVVVACLAAAVLGLVQPPASAAAPITVFLNGKEMVLDAPPILQSGRVLVPMRALFEALGARVEYIPESRAIVVLGNNKVIAMMVGRQVIDTLQITRVGSELPMVWLKTRSYTTIEVPPAVINGRTFVPLRFVGETLGAQVVWDGGNQTIQMTAAARGAAGVVSEVHLREIIQEYQYDIAADLADIAWRMDTMEYTANLGLAVDATLESGYGSNARIFLHIRIHNRTTKAIVVSPFDFTLMTYSGEAAPVHSDTFAFSDHLPVMTLPPRKSVV